MSQVEKSGITSFFPFPTKVRTTILAVTTTTSRLVRNNPGRVQLFVSNISASHVYISPRNTVSATEGIRLQANEGSISFTSREDGNLPELEWFVQGAGSVNILVVEVLRVK